MIFSDNTEEFSVSNIVVISGIRPFGRTVDLYSVGRTTHGLLYIWSGEATFRQNDGKTVKATDGQLIFLPKFLKYKMQYTGESTTFVLVNFDLFDKTGQSLALSKDITLLAEDPNRQIASIMSKFEVCSAAQNFAGAFRRKELFYRLLSKLYGNGDFPLEDQNFPQIAKGVLLLKQTYLENIPIEEFAAQSNLSISSFRTLFRKQYGTSPLQYRNMLRINRAKQLIESDNFTVAEAAYASGFENIGYFCRCYKKIMGETPGMTKKA